MKKIILLLVAFGLLITNVKAQKPDSVKAIVHYKFSHVRDTTNRDKPYTENMIMFLGSQSSAYKSYDRKLQTAMMQKQIAQQVADQKGSGGPMRISVKGTIATTSTEYYQFPLDKKLVRKERLITPYLIEEAMPVIDWSISNDTASFAGLHCQKATCHFKGRDYTAWFCPDLPFHSGPWKLNGLPGLIVEAYDTNKDVVFKFDSMEEADVTVKPATEAPIGGITVKMIGMDDNDDPNVVTLPTNAVKTTEKEFRHLARAMKKDPNAFAQSEMAGCGGGMRMGPCGGPGGS